MSDGEHAALLKALLQQREAHTEALRVVVAATESLQENLALINSDIEGVTRDARIAEARLQRMKQRLIETKRMGASPTWEGRRRWGRWMWS